LNSTNLTVQSSVLADSLHTTATNGYGSLLRYGHGDLTFHHNLYADNYDFNPRLGDNLSLDFVNNVVYNWGTNGVVTYNDSADNALGFTNYLNLVCNYFIVGSSFTNLGTAFTNIAFWGGTTNTWLYQSNNFIDFNTNHILDGANIGSRMLTNKFTLFDRAFPLPPVSVDETFR